MSITRLDQIKEKNIQSVKDLTKLGVNPFPVKTNRTHTNTECLEKDGLKVAVAGRLMSWRGHGKIRFADLVDQTGKIQLVFKADEIDEKSLENLRFIDRGDFLQASGETFTTKAGERSVLVKKYVLLVKAILPLPSQWHGLKDVEERYRKRYLDMILNPEVTSRLETRSKLITNMREFLDKRGFLEVETPTLQPVYGGGFAKPFSTHHNALGADFYLRISDEMYLKRLIVGGMEKVYEITKVFRNEGIDFDHNPEFTMFEAQIAYEDYEYGMDIIEEITEYAVKKSAGKTKLKYKDFELEWSRPWKRYRLVEAVKEYTGIDPLEWKTLAQAKKETLKIKMKEEKKAELNKMHTIGEVMAFAFEEGVEEKLIQPTIIYDYPIEVSPLAKKCKDERFTQRFEQFAAGSELGNNYTELNDPIDLKRRFIEEKKREKAGFDEAHQTDYDYLTAMEHGFPPTCGIAIGIDRLVMMITNADNLKEIIPFPTLKPEKAVGQKEKYDYRSNKVVAILSNKLSVGLASNALGHLAFASGHRAEDSWMGREVYLDAKGKSHAGIGRYPFVVLEASEKEIGKLVVEARDLPDVSMADYPQEMFDTGHDDDLNKEISKAKDMTYHAVVLTGPTDIINKLTQGLKLYGKKG
jgi:lysyl-tRNA synthetase, class II